MSQKLAEWIDTINKKLGTEFDLDESGQMVLEFEGGRRVGVEFADDQSRYDIFTPIGLLNSTADLQRVLAAMQLNLYQRATAGGVIALDMTSGTFVYSFSYPIQHSSAEILALQLDHFAEHADRLQVELEQVATEQGDFDFELEAMRQDFGLLTKSEADEFENQPQLDDRGSGPSEMIRV